MRVNKVDLLCSRSQDIIKTWGMLNQYIFMTRINMILLFVLAITTTATPV